jgi:predicted fused transcriptional regulator/phosphomethylpyrimidine kinase
MINTDNLNSCIDLANGASADLHRTMLYTMQQMADRIAQLEARLDRLSDLTVGDQHDSSFEARVIEALEERSAACRTALDLGWDDIERQVLSTIEENSYTVYTHIEAELEEKLDAMTQGYAFAEAVKEAVEGSIVQTVEEILDDRISNDFVGTDAEDVVRKGLRSIL